MNFFKKLSRRFGSSGSPRGKPGSRAYAIGDIHGRLDLLDQILDQIRLDVESRPPAETFVVFLGDLIDRGPSSCEVVERLRLFRPDWAKPVFLGGNHEEVLLSILKGDQGVLKNWLKFGGAECARSYGMDPDLLLRLDEPSAVKQLRAAIPPQHREFLSSFGDTFRFRDYLFVHAGIRPGLPLEEQTRSDLRWIRHPFLSDGKDHGFVVVHGHTIVEGVEERSNRIGIDTGAYRSGVLTALAIEEDSRWYLTTGDPEATKVRDRKD
jgi:serine/threonine protein phosphatase 1